jgi:hypothetical protein
MSTVRKVIRADLSIFVIGLFIAAPIMAQDVLEAVPADALFAVRVNNFEFTLGQLDQFLVGIAPTPNSASMMGRMQLANALGDPNLRNINLRGQMAVFGTAVPKEPNTAPQVFIAGLIPVTDYSKFITSNPSATKPDSNGIGTIGQMKMLVAQDAGFAILASSNEYAALANAVKTTKGKNLTSVLSAAQRQSSGKARIWAYGNVQQAMKLYGPIILAKMDEARKSVFLKDPNIAQLSQLTAVYFDAAKSLMNETKDVTIAANPKPDALAFTGTVTAVPGTEMAKTLVASAPVTSPNKLLGYLPNNALVNMAGRIDKPFIIKIYDRFLDIFAPLLGKTFTAQEKTKVQNLIKTSVSSLGSTFAYSAAAEPNSKPLFGAIYVFEVADANAFQKSVDAGVEIMHAPYMKDFMKIFGLNLSYEIRRNAEKYKGVSIDATTAVLRPIDPNSPTAQMMVKMYGENLAGRMAIVNGLALYSIGADADAHIKSLIDTVKAGGPSTINTEIKNAMALIPDSNQAQFFGTYNYLRAFQISLGFMPMMPFNTDALRQIVSKSNIAFACNVTDDAVTIDVALPKQHILEMKSAFETLTHKQPQQQMAPPKPQEGNLPQ